MMHVQNDPLVQNTTYYEDFHQEEKRAARITWCFGGKQVAITGSWDNWKTMYWNLLWCLSLKVHSLVWEVFFSQSKMQNFYFFLSENPCILWLKILLSWRCSHQVFITTTSLLMNWGDMLQTYHGNLTSLGVLITFWICRYCIASFSSVTLLQIV